MSKILFLTTTPTIGGNGDTLIHTAIEEAKKNGAEVKLVNIREKQIGFCKACYGCAKTGVCVQKDDFMEILKSAHEAEAIIAEAPIYYNCMAAQILTLPSISRTISEYKTEVFTQCISDTTCKDRADYLEKAKEITHWAMQV